MSSVVTRVYVQFASQVKGDDGNYYWRMEWKDAVVPEDKIELQSSEGTVMVWFSTKTKVGKHEVPVGYYVFVPIGAITYLEPEKVPETHEEAKKPEEVPETHEEAKESFQERGDEFDQAGKEWEDFNEVVEDDDTAYNRATVANMHYDEQLETAVQTLHVLWDHKNKIWNEQHIINRSLKKKLPFDEYKHASEKRAAYQLEWLVLVQIEKQLCANVQELDPTFDANEAFRLRFPDQVSEFHRTYGINAVFVYENKSMVKVFENALAMFFTRNRVPKWWKNELKTVAFNFIKEKDIHHPDKDKCGAGRHMLAEWVKE